jgi:hypothetical protein
MEEGLKLRICARNELITYKIEKRRLGNVAENCTRKL